MNPEHGGGWFPRINPIGEIVCGDVTISTGVPGSWRAHGAGKEPQWIGPSVVVYSDRADACILIDLRSGARHVIPTGPVNWMSGSLSGKWAVRRPGLTSWYDGATLLGTDMGIGLLKYSPDGTQSIYVSNPQENVKAVVVNNRVVSSGVVMDYDAGDAAVVWSVDDGAHGRKVYGVRRGTMAIEHWTVLAWEVPQVVDAPDGPWIFSATQTGFILRPAGAKDGYRHVGDVFNAHCKFVDGQFVVASSSAQGVLQTQTIDPSASRVDLTVVPYDPIVPIDRSIWFGFFEFGGHTNCAVNCRLVVEQAPWLTVRDVNGRPLYRYVAGDPDGDCDAIDRAVQNAGNSEIPVLAYTPRQASSIRLTKSVVGVECYRLASESIDAFESRVRATVARCPRAVLVAQCYSSNANNTTDLRSIPPVIARIARDMTNVEGVIVFSGSGRPTGFQDHPEVHEDWQRVAVTIRTPVLPLPIPPEVPPMKMYANVLKRIHEFESFFPVPQAPEAILGDADAIDRWVDTALRKGWMPKLAAQIRHDFGAAWGRKATSKDAPISKESIAQKIDGHMHVWDLLKGAATGRPVLASDPTHHDVPDQHFVPVDPFDSIATQTPQATRATITRPMWSVSSFDLGWRLASGDRRWIDQVLKPGRRVARTIVASAYRRSPAYERIDKMADLSRGRTQLALVLETLGKDGLKAAPTLVCDTRVFDLTQDEIRAHVAQCNVILKRFPGAVAAVRIANENSHSVEQAFMRDPDFLAELIAMIDPQFPCAPGAGHGGEGVLLAGGSFAAHHGDRSLDAVTNARIMFEAQQLGHRLVLDDEQIGIAKPGTSGQRVFDSAYLVSSVRECLRLGTAGVTAHIHAGLWADVDKLDDTQRAALVDFVRETGGAVVTPGPIPLPPSGGHPILDAPMAPAYPVGYDFWIEHRVAIEAEAVAWYTRAHKRDPEIGDRNHGLWRAANEGPRWGTLRQAFEETWPGGAPS